MIRRFGFGAHIRIARTISLLFEPTRENRFGKPEEFNRSTHEEKKKGEG